MSVGKPDEGATDSVHFCVRARCRVSAIRLRGVRRLLAFISAILFVDAMLFVAITPLVPSYADEYGLSDSAAGWLVAAFGIGAAIGGIPCGFLAMRVGPKATMVIGLLGVSLSSAALALAGDPWALGGARLAQGVSSAAV